jgi:hypothetical protein
MVSDFWNGFSYAGLSTDNLPHDCPNGSRFYVIDTGETYLFDEANDTWYDSTGTAVTES